MLGSVYEPAPVFSEAALDLPVGLTLPSAGFVENARCLMPRAAAMAEHARVVARRPAGALKMTPPPRLELRVIRPTALKGTFIEVDWRLCRWVGSCKCLNESGSCRMG